MLALSDSSLAFFGWTLVAALASEVEGYADVPAMTGALRGARAAYVIPPPLPVTESGHHAYRVSRTETLAVALAAARVPTRRRTTRSCSPG
ncbi:MAG: hypothetical protein HYV09_31485 [Deltaproteobacteria bacterium]|nr:hypothetical protein [Deltaproteobacteria bacterium]